MVGMDLLLSKETTLTTEKGGLQLRFALALLVLDIFEIVLLGPIFYWALIKHGTKQPKTVRCYCT